MTAPSDSSPWLAVLDHYAPHFRSTGSITHLESGGLSGADVWRIAGHLAPLAATSAAPAKGLILPPQRPIFPSAASNTWFALRAWPAEHPSPERLAWIHAVQRHAAQTPRLASAIPVPIPHRAGGTYVRHAGRLWELAPWLLGEFDQWDPPSPRRSDSAVQLVAHFHLAVSDFALPCPDATAPRTLGPAPGIVERLQLVTQLVDGRAAELRRLCDLARLPLRWPQFSHLADQWLAEFPRLGPLVQAALRQASQIVVRLIPCLRDIKRDHVLFQREQAVALVDWGALRTDSIAADLGRLLGSWWGDDAAGWTRAFDSYREVAELSSDESWLAEQFDISGVLLGGANWLEWVVAQGRQFADRDAVERRFGELVQRLRRLEPRLVRR